MPKIAKITTKPGEYDIEHIKNSETTYTIIPADYGKFLSEKDKEKIHKTGDTYKLKLDASDPEWHDIVEVTISDRHKEGYYSGSYKLSGKGIVTFKIPIAEFASHFKNKNAGGRRRTRKSKRSCKTKRRSKYN